MPVIDIDTKTRVADLLEKAATGEEFIIAVAGTPPTSSTWMFISSSIRLISDKLVTRR